MPWVYGFVLGLAVGLVIAAVLIGHMARSTLVLAHRVVEAQRGQIARRDPELLVPAVPRSSERHRPHRRLH